MHSYMRERKKIRRKKERWKREERQRQTQEKGEDFKLIHTQNQYGAIDIYVRINYVDA